MTLDIQHLTKRYATGVYGLRDFSLTLETGVLGLLGPNGAGKSTLMRILATISKPTSGRVLWNGADARVSPDAVRRVLGYLPQDFGVYPNLTAVEFLDYIAAAKGMESKAARTRIEELLRLVNLTDDRNRPLGEYSGGMRQRVGIAQALLNDPRLLIVDEPTGGLDPAERVRFRNLLSELSGERIVILSTHIVSDVEATATRIAVISAGTLVAASSPEELLASAAGAVWEWLVSPEQLASVKRRYVLSGSVRKSDGIRVRLLSRESPDRSAQQVPPTLEDAYLLAIGRPEGEASTAGAVEDEVYGG